MSRIRTLIATESSMMGGLLAFIALAFGLEYILGAREPVELGPIFALLIAGMPAFLWLGYFHSQDRHETRPKRFVLGAFVLGAFVAGPVAGFLVEVAKGNPYAGLHHHARDLDRWVYALAIVGIAQEGSKYAAIRYTLYDSSEFDEPLDGIVYMSAVGIGFASYLTYAALHANGNELYLGSAVVQSVVTALAHVSFAGILGCALGYARFSAQGSLARTISLTAGLTLAAFCSAVFRIFADDLRVNGFASTPWRSVVFSFAFAVSVGVLKFVLLRRMTAVSPLRAEVRGEQEDGAGGEEGDEDE